jgi:hypothetical protein
MSTRETEYDYDVDMATLIHENRLERNYNLQGTTTLVDVVRAPETPFFQVYFKLPRIRSSRGLTSFPIREGS